MAVISQYDPGGCGDHLGLRLTLDQPHLEDDVPREGLEHQGGDARMVTVGSSSSGGCCEPAAKRFKAR